MARSRPALWLALNDSQGAGSPQPTRRRLRCPTPERLFGPLRMFRMANSNHPNHMALARELHKHRRWRNANARHPDVLAAQRRERARVRSERQQRWGRPRRKPPEHRAL